MDWTFYLVMFFILLGFIGTALTVRLFVARRLEKLEKERRAEEEARQIAESNSGL